MAPTVEPLSEEQFVAAAASRIETVFNSVCDHLVGDAERAKLAKLRSHFEPGKMLRSRLGWALCPADADDVNKVISACAATELIHTATLFHDDVIDGAALRRNQPPLWREVGATGAILMGDLFFSSALELLVDTGDLRNTASFVRKVREVCATEMVHELVYKDADVNAEQSALIARGKTGPLFAFVTECCGGDDEAKRATLEEAGYAIGTAYQIADDLLDEIGDENVIGKTLGTDRKRRKYTIAQDNRYSEDEIRARINTLCTSAVDSLKEWPALSERLSAYVNRDLVPLWDYHVEQVG